MTLAVRDRVNVSHERSYDKPNQVYKQHCTVKCKLLFDIKIYTAADSYENSKQHIQQKGKKCNRQQQGEERFELLHLGSLLGVPGQAVTGGLWQALGWHSALQTACIDSNGLNS
jgi:hypothetical protein